MKRPLLLVFCVLGMIVALGALLYRSKTRPEKARVAEAQAMTETQFNLNLDAQVQARWGRFLRMEGEGYEHPPFMSPGGDYLTAIRTAHFERGSVRVRIYAPGLSESLAHLHPHLQLNGNGPEILVNFGATSQVDAYQGEALFNRSRESLAKAQTLRVEVSKSLAMHLGPISFEGTCLLAEGNRLRVEVWVSPRFPQSPPTLRLVSNGKTMMLASPWETRSVATPADLNARYLEEAAKVGFFGPMEFLKRSPGPRLEASQFMRGGQEGGLREIRYKVDFEAGLVGSVWVTELTGLPRRRTLTWLPFLSGAEECPVFQLNGAISPGVFELTKEALPRVDDPLKFKLGYCPVLWLERPETRSSND